MLKNYLQSAPLLSLCLYSRILFWQSVIFLCAIYLIVISSSFIFLIQLHNFLQFEPKNRPTFNDIVAMLEKIIVSLSTPEPGIGLLVEARSEECLLDQHLSHTVTTPNKQSKHRKRKLFSSFSFNQITQQVQSYV